MNQRDECPYECLADQMMARSTVQKERSQPAAEQLHPTLSNTRNSQVKEEPQPGCHPYGFCLHKGAFTNALALRCGWSPSWIPLECDCGSSFIVEHVFSCPRGDFPTICHNEILNITAYLLMEVCHNVMTEPDLQSLTGEAMSRLTSSTTDGARLDIAVNGFWGDCYERVYLDVIVFNLHAPTNRKSRISNCYRKHE